METAAAAAAGVSVPGNPAKPSLRMEGSCMELALEGERLCKAGDCRGGVHFFEAAVQVGTDDLKTLSAIYSQLGNAYFYLQEYSKALEYHKHDLNLARTIGDKLGEAKASGNLGNTLKVLGKFEEAVACCQRHLDISKDISDKIGEARALYNLGNVYHAKGKHAGRSANQDPGDFPPQVKECLQKAAKYYEANLEIVQQLGDRAAQGRACGNLGNTHYLLGNFGQAIRYHEERLAIAREFGDKSAERRAHSNLGNAHIFLGEFDTAAEEYKKTLQIAKHLLDRALEAQACYSLGNTYTLLRDYPLAIEYHLQHLRIAQELNDKIGEGRACWSLGNAHSALGDHEKALQYANQHLSLSKEIGDETGQLTAQMNLTDLRTILGINDQSIIGASDQSSLSDSRCHTDASVKRPPRTRRVSMENMEQIKMTPDKDTSQQKGARPKPPKVQKAATVGSEYAEKIDECTQDSTRKPNSAAPRRVTPELSEDDGFFDLLTRSQSRRIDDQRCSFQENGNKENRPAANSAQTEEFLDMVAGIQGSRMNDQRASAPDFPGLHNTQAVIGPYMNNVRSGGRASNLDDQFFEMLMRCQGSRMEDQRTTLPAKAAPTVPDEDFFSLIQRVQSNRLDEQRSSLPRKRGGGGGGGNSASNPSSAGGTNSSRSGGSGSSSSGGGRSHHGKKKDKK